MLRVRHLESLILAMIVGVGFTGCVRDNTPPADPNPAVGPYQDPYAADQTQDEQNRQDQQTFPDHQQGNKSNQNDSEALVPFVIDEKSFQKYQIVADNAKAKLTYGSFTQTKDIEFENGKAEILFQKLPIGKTHKLSLDILEGTTLKLSGSVDAVTLKEGTNRLRLVLKSVDSSADLELDLNIGNNDNNPPDNGGSGDNGNSDNGGGDNGNGQDPGRGGNNPPDDGGNGNGQDPGRGGTNPPGDGGNDPDANLDVDLANVTYKDVKKHVIDIYCIQCHDQDTDIVNLKSFPFRSSYFRTQKFLVQRLIESTGKNDPKPMPPEPQPRLSEKRRQILIKWLERGLPE